MRSAIGIVALLASAATAQDNATTTLPPPSIDRFSLPPGRNQPTPTPSPSPTLTPAPPPSVIPTLPTLRPTPALTPVPAATPAPTPGRTAPAVRPTPTPTPAATPTAGNLAVAPDATPPPPLAETAPAATSTPVPEAGATAAPSGDATASGPPAWLWWVVGLLLAAGAGFLLWRRAAGSTDTPFAHADDAVLPEPAPQPDPVPPPTPGPPARIGGGAAVQPDRALAIDFRPQRLWTRGPDAHLAFELVVTNTGRSAVDAVRPVVALVSAGPDTAAEIAAFAADATLPGGEPFDLRAGESRSIVGELTLSGDAMYVTSAADRELIVPVVLVSLAWRGGVSLSRTSEAFVVGTGDASAPRLGPIWVDRAGLVYGKLDARRFTAG